MFVLAFGPCLVKAEDVIINEWDQLVVCCRGLGYWHVSGVLHLVIGPPLVVRRGLPTKIILNGKVSFLELIIINGK